MPEARGSEVIERDLFPQSISLAEYSEAIEAPGMHGTCARRRQFTDFEAQGVYPTSEGDVPEYGIGYELFIAHDPDQPCHEYQLRRQIRVTFNLAPLRRYQGVEVSRTDLHFNVSGGSYSNNKWLGAEHCTRRVLVAEADDPVGGLFPWLTEGSRSDGISSLRDRSSVTWWWPLDLQKSVVEHWLGGGWSNHGLVIDPVFDEEHNRSSEVENSGCVTALREFRLKVRFSYRDLAPIDDPDAAILLPGGRIGTDVPVVPAESKPKQADLVVPSVQVRGKKVTSGSNCDPGDSTVLATIRNIGDERAGPFGVRLQVDGVDRLVAPLPGLDAGGEQVAVFEKVRLEKGDRTLRLIADVNGQVTESDEANNVLEQKVSCRD